jgi:hypothetical protein
MTESFDWHFNPPVHMQSWVPSPGTVSAAPLSKEQGLISMCSPRLVCWAQKAFWRAPLWHQALPPLLSQIQILPWEEKHSTFGLTLPTCSESRRKCLGAWSLLVPSNLFFICNTRRMRILIYLLGLFRISQHTFTVKCQRVNILGCEGHQQSWQQPLTGAIVQKAATDKM